MRKIAIVLLSILCLLAFGGGLTSAAFADEDINANFATSYVLDDLAGANIDGKVFNTKDYPSDSKGELRLISFMEYAFTLKEDLRGHYGLYFYLYNPRRIEFADDERNTVELATEYIDGTPTKYEKLNLKICSISAERLFVKLRIDNVADIYDRVVDQPEERRYDISGIELTTPGAVNATDYKIGGTWIYTGYARGCGDDVLDNTLQCAASTSQTLEISDLQHTYYRNWVNGIALGNRAQQLNSVYFSVPTYFAEQYKRLYSIQAETYQYLTSPVVVLQPSKDSGFMSSDKVYSELLAQRGIDNPYLRTGQDRILYWDSPYSSSTGDTNRRQAHTGYNFGDSVHDDFVRLNTLAYVFQSDAAVEISVQSDMLQRYMQDYSNMFGNKEIRGKYSADLFADRYYSYGMGYPSFESGYKYMDIDISGKNDWVLLESDSTQSWWDRLWHGTNMVDSKPFTPIMEVKYADLKGLTDKDISERYYIAESEAGKFYDYLLKNSDRTVYLFHFALSDYFSTSVYNNYGYIGFMAQEAAFLDFDIISLGYENDMGHIEIIPVVSNPIDILSSIESGSPVTGWDKFLDSLDAFMDKVGDFFRKVGDFFVEYWWILVVIGVLFLLGILSIFFPVLRVVFKWLWIGIKWIFKILWYIISAPVRLVVLLINKAKAKKEGSG